MSRKILIVAVLLMAAVNIVLIRAQMRLGYDLSAKIKEPPEEHAEGYGLECIECHHVESCSHCHSKNIQQIEVEESKVALHKNCLNCHRGMEVGPLQCDECHKQ